MSKWNANREGYADNTASIAIQRVSKEERKNDMAKRSCTDESITLRGKSKNLYGYDSWLFS